MGNYVWKRSLVTNRRERQYLPEIWTCTYISTVSGSTVRVHDFLTTMHMHAENSRGLNLSKKRDLRHALKSSQLSVTGPKTCCGSRVWRM